VETFKIILCIVYLCILCIRRSSLWLLYFNKRVCVNGNYPLYFELFILNFDDGNRKVHSKKLFNRKDRLNL